MVTTKLVTAQDLLNMGGRGDNFELIKGELVEVVPPDREHGRIVTNIAVIVGAHVKSHKLGRLYTGDIGFVLRRHPDTVLGPDLAFVSSARLQANDSGYGTTPPDIAMEVVSPGNSNREIERKVSIYLESGVRSVWIVFPQLRQVVLHAAGDTPRTLSDLDTISGGEILPGLSIPIAAIFDD